MFTDNQISQLSADLDRSAVRNRQQGGSSVSYVEGWWCIDKANKIFGYGNWSRETVVLNEVCREERKIGKQQKEGFKVGYFATVKITVHKDGQKIEREGTGHGSGIATDLFDAIEGAAKEAETDAMKRALMTFGNQFGLALYDKEQKSVSDPAKIARDNEVKQKAIAAAKDIAKQIEGGANKEEVLDAHIKQVEWIKSNCPEALKEIEQYV